jgi:hypothetical protein
MNPDYDQQLEVEISRELRLSGDFCYAIYPGNALTNHRKLYHLPSLAIYLRHNILFIAYLAGAFPFILSLAAITAATIFDIASAPA